MGFDRERENPIDILDALKDDELAEISFYSYPEEPLPNGQPPLRLAIVSGAEVSAIRINSAPKNIPSFQVFAYEGFGCLWIGGGTPTNVVEREELWEEFRVHKRDDH